MKRASATPFLLVFVLTGACGNAPPDEALDEDSDRADRFEGLEAGPHTLFGRPTDDNAITPGCCMPTCLRTKVGNTPWTAPQYTKEDMEALLSDWKLAKPWPVFEGNQFDPPPEEYEDPLDPFVCAVLPRPDLYDGNGGPMPYDLIDGTLSEVERSEGAMVTHGGRCGACSSLKNLAIYIANPNLTNPIRACAITGLFDRDLSRLTCIAGLGFDLPCAQAWDINTQNTQKQCLKYCGKPKARREPSNTPFDCHTVEVWLPVDHELVNDCLACDERESLHLFRSAAGRSRRGSGLPSPICRLCDGVYPVKHYYPRPEL
jgi:hypothetical protein